MMSSPRFRRTAAVIAFVTAFLLWPASDERDIQEILDTLTEAANRAPKVQFLEQVTIVRASGKHLVDQISGTLKSGDEERTFSHSRKELEEQALAAAKYRWRELEVKLTNVSVRAKRPNAEATFELHILGALEGADGNFYEHWAVTLGFVRESANWLITKADAKNLREPAT